MEKYIKMVPLALFSLTVGKLLFFTATWEGAATAFIAGFLVAATEYKNHDKKLEELEKKLELITTVVNNHAKAIEDTKSGVSALKVATQMRTQTTSSNPVQRVF